MLRTDFLCDLGPGDKFLYKDTYYIVVDYTPPAGFENTAITDMVVVLDTDTYKIMYLNKNTQVEVLYYYGGLT